MIPFQQRNMLTYTSVLPLCTGWLKRRKSTKKTFSSDYVRRFFKLQCDAENHYTLFYSHEAGDDVRVMTKVPIVEGTKLLTPTMLPVPTPFALGITVQKVSDFSFAGSSELVCTASLGSQRQRTRGIAPKETTEFNSTLLLPVQSDLLAHAGESVTTVNIGWFGEEVALQPRDDAPGPKLTFSLTDGSSSSSSAEPIARASVPFEQLPFGRAQELVLPLEGTAAAGAELTVSASTSSCHSSCCAAYASVEHMYCSRGLCSIALCVHYC
jgi:hypothetical protein